MPWLGEFIKVIMSESNIVRRESNFFRNLVIVLLSIASVTGIILFSVHLYKKNNADKPTKKAIVTAWKNYDYQKVFEYTHFVLEENPFNNFALTYQGYACFFLAVSQLENSSAQNYLDDCINNLRIALLNANKKLKPQLQYILGKAYFYKNTVSSYYYSDLAVKYLLLAKKNGYKADDIAEYLGLSYAALGLTMESISAFSEALLVRESDSLLLSIAEQYAKAGQNAAAKQYLFRVTNDCKDEILVLKGMNLLGSILISEEKYEEARILFENILKKNKNSGDAYYGLGVIYEKKGDIVKARSEWRKALKVQVNHNGALTKIADYN